MAYDRDSFLSGLAVGRTLWKPPYVLAGGGEFFIASAFPFQRADDMQPPWLDWYSETTLNWTWSGESGTYNFTGIKIYLDGAPEPSYWCLEYGTDTNRLGILCFSPNPPYRPGGIYVVKIYGITQGGDEVLCLDTLAVWSTLRADSKWIKGIMNNLTITSMVNVSQFLNEYSQAGYLYYNGPATKMSDYWHNSILVGADQKYLAGFVYD